MAKSKKKKIPTRFPGSCNFEHTTISYLLHSMTQAFYDYESGEKTTNENLSKSGQDKLLGMLLTWPPDLFAVCSEILRRSGTYIDVAHRWPPYGSQDDLQDGSKDDVPEPVSYTHLTLPTKA